MTPEELLSELEDIIRMMPPREKLHHETPENLAWFGRAAAAIDNWNTVNGVAARGEINMFMAPVGAAASNAALNNFLVYVYQAAGDLRLKTVGPVNVAIGVGEVFRYFDAVRQVIELAKTDLLFVDRYMGPEFVTKYLPLVPQGARVRLLTRDKVAAVVAAASAFAEQHGTQIEVRSGSGFHDRWLFIDDARCYQSGASFKDGGRKDSTTLTQNVDGFADLLRIYEGHWQSGTVHPLLR